MQAAIPSPVPWRSRPSKFIRKRDIVGHVRHVEPVFLERLARVADHPLVGEARGVGLIAGVELVADKAKKASFDPAKAVALKLCGFAEEEGLIIRALLAA